ncbi:MAG: universal stress protein [Thermodesulfobacteriota bacterium]|nr:universal stress protein [Thermodesulfobacteriota bacterium]
MKTLICVDGGENALKAVRLAGRFACTVSEEATFLHVQRHRSQTRTQPLVPQTIAISAEQWRQTPEMKSLLEAEDVFKKTRTWEEHRAELGEPQTALIQVGDGVLEVGRVQLGSDSGVHLRIRPGVPQEEILAELEEARYDLAILGAHRIPGCAWSEIENGPLYVAQKAQLPVMVIGREFEEGQPLLVCVGEKDPPESTLELVRVAATRMKTDIDVLRVLKSPDPGFSFSEKVSFMMERWLASGLKVTPKVAAGDPVTMISEMAPDYGLIVCSFADKHKKGRLGKVTKNVLCSQFNLLVTR